MRGTLTPSRIAHSGHGRWRVTFVLSVFWAGAALLALWSLVPEQRSYAVPQDWTHVAPDMQVQDILVGAEQIWIAGIEGLVRIDADGRTAKVPVEGADAEPMIRAIKRDDKGVLWLAHRKGLSTVTGKGRQSEHVPDSGFGAMRALAVDRAGRLWAGGEGGVFLVQSDHTLLSLALPREDVEVTALLVDRRGTLWAGTVKHGLMQLVDEVWSVWGTDEGLPHPQVTSLMQDRDGSIWVGTGFYSRGGAARLDDQSGEWSIAQVLTGGELAGAKVRSLYRDVSGTLLIGHEYDGLTLRRDGQTVATFGPAQGLPDPEVTVIRSDGAGGLWIGTLKGAVHLPAEAKTELFSKHPGENDDA